MCLNNSYQTVCGVSVDHYRRAGSRAAIAWCVRVRAQVLRAIVADRCLPPHVDHPNFEAFFMPSVRVDCNMVHGGGFSSVVRPQFDRLVKHYAKRWVIANGVVIKDTNEVPNRFRFNQELVDRCFKDVDSIEHWLREDLGKLDWWEKVAHDPGLIAPSTPCTSTVVLPTPATPTTPVIQSRRRVATTPGQWKTPTQSPMRHKRTPSSVQMEALISGLETLGSDSDFSRTPLIPTPTRCHPGPPSTLFSDLASGSHGEDQMPGVACLAPEEATPVLGLDLWAPITAPIVGHGSLVAKDTTPVLNPCRWKPAPTTPVKGLSSRAMFPPTPTLSISSCKAPSTVPSTERSVWPLSWPPAPSTIAPSTAASLQNTKVGNGSTVGDAPPSVVSSASSPLSSTSSLLEKYFRESPKPPPAPTTVLTYGETDTPLALDVSADPGSGTENGSGDDKNGDKNRIRASEETDWYERTKESLKSTQRAWEMVVEADIEAQAVIFGIDGMV
ncbi:uncharacterized protein CTRU02_215802 [Colletotrichum truncatum]|uniref:Uncharacterized protein n=1 Tax=Colletotrichum truncatum TaxID=5467 RepID=A0ACC3YBN9_COLTU|nr:uncharacterized protein CTRU02_15077 [Colletotrichum truncatum]KAF6781437.1 hypothetical protein CTRU02_15077 [Colletotrichum truncatum]